jgi:hypothetical protein
MSAQPEPNPSEGSGGPAVSFQPDSFPPGADAQPIRPRNPGVVLPLWPNAASQARLGPHAGGDGMVEASGGRTGAARGLLLGLVLGAALWVVIGMAVWRLLLH